MIPESQNYNELKAHLRDMFQMDQPDLDFGIYRIMNQKREEIEQFLDKDLLPQVRTILQNNQPNDKDAISQEIIKLENNLRDAGIDPETSPKVQELRQKMTKTFDVQKMESELYSDLYNFFKRYYSEGDFMSLRRYKEGVYALPYEGEEVKLHWANHDQYYIKTSENLKNYSFKTGENRRVRFEITQAGTELNNNKADKDKERRFILHNENPITENGNELIIRFEFRSDNDKRKQDEINKETFVALCDLTEIARFGLLDKSPTDKNPNRTKLEKHLTDFTAKNSFDYFIHKDLGKFLRQELDFYIKNEIMHLDDIDNQTADYIEGYLSKIRAMRAVAGKIITFLASLEDFQKKLWLKKKFVLDTHYCITLDHIIKADNADELLGVIASNQAQIDEWVKLFAIDEIKGDLGKLGFDSLGHCESVCNERGNLESLKQSEIATSGLRPPRGDEDLSKAIQFLKQNDKLLIDTKFFPVAFKYRLLSLFDNLDAQTDGVLINSENFQALNLLQERYREKVKCIYIDPPYNAKSSEILYKNTYKHSSWLSLINDRLIIAKTLQNDKSVLTIAIDEIEQEYLGQLIEINYSDFEKNCIVINHNPSGQQGDNFSYTHEYAYFVYPKSGRIIGEQIRDNVNDWDERNFRDVTGDDSLRKAGANCFYPIFIKDNKIIGFGDICPNEFHPKINESMPNGITAIYPIDPEGIERKWRFARNTVESIQDELKVHFIQKRNIFDIKRLKKKFNFKSNWVDARYSANNHGTQLLNKMIPKAPASYPKSLYTVIDCIFAALNHQDKEIILDYFAGSGTTGHAVINLNREDNGSRKYILVEMGAYFDSVTKPRIQKAVYSKDWKDGKPVGRDGVSQIIKYLSLEQYEDSLDNLGDHDTGRFGRTQAQQEALDHANRYDNQRRFYEGYMLSYMLDIESRGSHSLLNIDKIDNPFDYRLKITRNDETHIVKVDLIETFNYLLGLVVDHIDYDKSGIIVIKGINALGERTMIIWRNVTEINNHDLDKWFSRRYSSKDFEFDAIYVNGDNNIENMKLQGDMWKVRLIEAEFKRLMFSVTDV